MWAAQPGEKPFHLEVLEKKVVTRSLSFYTTYIGEEPLIKDPLSRKVVGDELESLKGICDFNVVAATSECHRYPDNYVVFLDLFTGEELLLQNISIDGKEDGIRIFAKEKHAVKWSTNPTPIHEHILEYSHATKVMNNA